MPVGQGAAGGPVVELAQTFWLLLVGHCLADYPLQGDFLARAKNHTSPMPGVPWPFALVSHALIHSGVVWLLTGSHALAAMEFCLHTGIDYAKSDRRISFVTDQLMHVCCKAFYVGLMA